MKMGLIFCDENIIDGNIIKSKFLMKLSIEIKFWWKIGLIFCDGNIDGNIIKNKVLMKMGINIFWSKH